MGFIRVLVSMIRENFNYYCLNIHKKLVLMIHPSSQSSASRNWLFFFCFSWLPREACQAWSCTFFEYAPSLFLQHLQLGSYWLYTHSLCELVSYLTGLPILGYSLDIGKEHVNLVDKQLEKMIYSGKLDQKELDRYSLCFSLSKYVHNFCTPLFILHSVRLLHQTVDCNLTCN
jgi:hypothetical protein